MMVMHHPHSIARIPLLLLLLLLLLPPPKDIASQ
jgi:hypothetical protein